MRVLRAIFHNCWYIRACPYKYGRLSHTGAEFLPNSAIETQKTQKLGVFAEILTLVEPLGGTQLPRASTGKISQKSLRNILNGKAGGPPLTDNPLPRAQIFSPKAAFSPKKLLQGGYLTDPLHWNKLHSWSLTCLFFHLPQSPQNCHSDCLHCIPDWVNDRRCLGSHHWKKA